MPHGLQKEDAMTKQGINGFAIENSWKIQQYEVQI
jgi:hypothetical protein